MIELVAGNYAYTVNEELSDDEQALESLYC